MHLSVRFSTEKELKQFQDLLYEKSGQGVSFTGLLEAMVSEVTIVTAVHNIKSNKGSKTAGVDRMKMDKYLQMPKEELFQLIQSNISNYKPKPAKRKYIEKANGKKRPLGIPTVLDRIIQECMRLILEPICEARFYPHSYGFRPYRAQKHAIRDIVNVINASVKSKGQPVWAVEGDIKGCFDNINHRLLLKKLWRIGIHDKRVLKIISQMLKAGYIDQDLYHATEMGTPQGGILSPLLSNVYLNDFDWYVGRCYMEPHRQCKHKCNDTRRLKWSGITPKYNFRYADDWVILTSTEQEAFRMKHELTKYFKHRMKLELSQEKTYVTDLRKNGIHFLGYIVKAERKRKTPDPATWSDNLVGKPFPDMERLTKKIHTLQKEVRKIGLYTQSNTQAAQIQYVNSVIMGLAQYLQPSICSHAYHAIDRRVNNTALAVWKNLFPKQYNQMQVPLKELSNLPHRHEGYDSKTFAIQIDGKWFGITYAFITHSRYESKPFDQKMTPYTEDGRRRYVNYRTKHKPLPCDRPSINTPEDIALSIYASGKGWKANFEYFMNREYAYNRDNMLLITNDGRKLALDQRLVNPMLPSDPDSKAAKCAENVFEIWQRTADQRSTQMIFCDLSTPGKERPIEMVQKEDGSFGMAPFQNVYEDIRTKLIELGVPENEIAFIHNAKSEVQKKDLFGKVRNGQVRILLGSTQRMGAGTNCQQKLVALHHLDCPWRPSDLQQREGRIIRQGNENKEVDIYSYVTEGTFDAYLYQLVESKQKFISQIMTSKSPVRSAEDVDEQALSYAEIKALASGNPLIKEKMDLDIEVSKLKLLKSNHLSQRYALEDAISKTFPKNIAEARERISGYEADIAAVKENTHPNADGFSPLTLMGVTYAEKKEAGAALLSICQNMLSPEATQIGSYRGLTLELEFHSFSQEYRLTMIGQLRHTVTLGTDVFGNLQRMDNALEGLPIKEQTCREQLSNLQTQLETAKVEVQKPFPREAELNTKTARLEELNTLLNLDHKEPEIVDAEPDEDQRPPERRRPQLER